MMRLAVLFTLLSFVILCIRGDEELAKHQEKFEHFCKPDGATPYHIEGQIENFCHCEIVPSPMIGRPAVKIDCMLSDGVNNLTNKVFAAEKLPLNTISLILSYQLFTSVPEFSGNLTELDMSNNAISIIKESNFGGISSLQRLDLSYNRISQVLPDAFASLTTLHFLDLSSNLLVVIPANTFATLIRLETLKLSSNEGFGRLMGRDAPKSSLIKLYHQLGVTNSLKSLEMERCNISNINLVPGTGLENVNLGFNEILDFSKLELPGNIKRLELSGNPVREFKPYSLSHVNGLVELIMEDMPFMGELDRHSLYGLSKLQRLSLEGSKNLSLFHHSLFGDENETQPILKVLNLRGCNIRHMSSSMGDFIASMASDGKLYLDGNPFTCDCELKWIKEALSDSDIKCYRPVKYQDVPLNEISAEDMECCKMSLFMKKVINSLILLVLLVSCSLAIWCFFRQLSPNNRRKKFQKVGPESPYQRVTIEPNRAEYSLH